VLKKTQSLSRGRFNLRRFFMAMRHYQLQAFAVLYLSQSQFRRYGASAVLSGVWRFSSSLLPAGDVATAPLAPHVVTCGRRQRCQWLWRS